MKIGKQQKRFGGPSADFQQRKSAALRDNSKLVPPEGPLKIFLDDTRSPPDGWTLVESAGALTSLLESDGDRITHLSLDWHLGPGLDKGDAAAEYLADGFIRNPLSYPKLEWIYFHSTKRDAALAMFRTVRKALPEDRRYDILMDVGMPETAGRDGAGRY